PVGEETAELARVAGDRIVDAGALQRSRELRAKALPDQGEGGIERQRCEIAPARAKITGRIECLALVVEDQDPVLKQADEVVTYVHLEQAVAQQRMLGGQAEFPGAL